MRLLIFFYNRRAVINRQSLPNPLTRSDYLGNPERIKHHLTSPEQHAALLALQAENAYYKQIFRPRIRPLSNK